MFGSFALGGAGDDTGVTDPAGEADCTVGRVWLEKEPR